MYRLNQRFVNYAKHHTIQTKAEENGVLVEHTLWILLHPPPSCLDFQ